MSQRREPLVTGYYYHIFNRGVARQPTFISSYDYSNAKLGLSYYRFKDPQIPLSRFKELSIERREEFLANMVNEEKLVEIHAYVFMPNHFHFLLKQLKDGGISQFLSKFTNSYTRYFNMKHNRVGPVFQGRFKSILVESTEQLVHLSRYIHLNPVASAVVKENELLDYKWSSLRDYLDGKSSIVSLQDVLSTFSNPEKYRGFVFDHAAYAEELEKVKHLTFENE